MNWDLERLLLPIDGDTAVGPSLRGDPVYKAIQEARREEDASLPRGIWTTDLKRASWPDVERLARGALSARSKDLMLAVWLGEAWLQQYTAEGLQQALTLMAQLCRAFWPDLHPQLEGQDPADRVSALEWMDERYARLARRHLVLFRSAGGEPFDVTLEGWETQERHGGAPAVKTERGAKVSPELAAARAQAAKNLRQLKDELSTPAGVARLQSGLAAWRRAEEALAGLKAVCDDLLGAQAPAFSALHAVSAQLSRVAHALKELCPPGLPIDEAPPVAAAPESAGPQTEAREPDSPTALAGAGEAVALPRLNGREDAYRQLSLIAAYLSKVEPHSPVPYLIRKAVDWGQMPLDELLGELHQEDAQARRLWTLMGIFRS